MIGIFGVGGKRAGVALGEQVEIRTRFRNEQSLELDITKEWLEFRGLAASRLRLFQISNGVLTQVDISRLRRPFISTDIGAIRAHFGEVYSWFIRRGCVIELNGVPVEALTF